ncbi:glycine oxidase ThiO [Gilvimarinus agarilyticus]|uniref:glycine oxidase ThiO n=1 Tax=Gilvimarinus sp. 2_MG-2023 TaxID=3062666 RepID=UPI001C09F709|nr:glycine oxidase ThiO [Gilvimarinus sp. 2_MG-2023]MBU2887296.1 glycine oxidase ThiO [Gilvimarinus agarilyticus]MDO6571955.1 glycine oxidase ThiO [Gilvimarinus sp. 2_MG-2023]
MHQYPTAKHPLNIAIAGYGLLGRLLAWRLLLLGHSVTVYDKGRSGSNTSAAYSAAGMLAPISEAAASHPSIYRAGTEAINTWANWCSELGLSHAIQQQGSLIVAHPQDRAELTQFYRDSQRIAAENTSMTLTMLNRQQVSELEPDLSNQLDQGLWINPEAHLDNRALLAGLDQWLQRTDVTIWYDSEVSVSPKQITDLNSGRHFQHDWVIDCRGAGARFDQPTLRGVRGETLHLETREVTLQRPVRLMHPRYQLYIVPKPNHRFVIGATQLESEDLSPISLQSNLELSSAVYTLAPAFAEARILEAGVNLRPAYANNLPHVSANEGLISANGLFRHGYLLAPLVVAQTLSILHGQNNLACEQLISQPHSEQATHEV